ncbi:UNVERIFIED_ORG: hypothetical protein ABID57_001276 [Arthrobacter sp. UYEF1]
MSNPASEILTIFKHWQDAASGSSPTHVVRGWNGGDFHAEHLHVIKSLAEISRVVDQLEAGGRKVGAHRRGIDLITTALLNAPYNWADNGGNNGTMTPHMFDVLEMLESELDHQGPKLSSGSIDSAKALLDDVLAALDDDGTLPNEVRAHISGVIAVVRGYLDNPGSGTEADLGESLRQLWIALYAAAGATKDAGARTKFTGFAEKIYYPTVSGFIASLPGLTLTALQLTQGPS